ncbi:hypothetical protein Pgin01_01031 [Porphyromonas gingivalis]
MAYNFASVASGFFGQFLKKKIAVCIFLRKKFGGLRLKTYLSGDSGRALSCETLIFNTFKRYEKIEFFIFARRPIIPIVLGTDGCRTGRAEDCSFCGAPSGAERYSNIQGQGSPRSDSCRYGTNYLGGSRCMGRRHRLSNALGCRSQSVRRIHSRRIFLVCQRNDPGRSLRSFRV